MDSHFVKSEKTWVHLSEPEKTMVPHFLKTEKPWVHLSDPGKTVQKSNICNVFKIVDAGNSNTVSFSLFYEGGSKGREGGWQFGF